MFVKVTIREGVVRMYIGLAIGVAGLVKVYVPYRQNFDAFTARFYMSLSCSMQDAYRQPSSA
jgi:hypothetical protein